MKKSNRIVSMVLLAALLVSLAAMAPAPGPAQASRGAAQANPITSDAVVRLYYDGQEQLNAVAGQLDVWEVHRESGYAVAKVTPDQAAWLQSLGYRLEVDLAKTEKLGTEAALDPRFYYYDSYNYNSYDRYLVDFLPDLNAQYPDLTEVINAGPTWQNLHWIYPRSVFVLRITNEDPAFGEIADKPAFVLHAEIHAREVATPELAIRYAKYLTEGFDGEGGYGVDPDVTWLVNHNVAYLLFMANPDGRVVNEDDINAYRRKNMDSDDGCNDPYSWGVDLNRNHSFKWGCCGGSSTYPCDETYRGPARGGEPETLAFQTFFASVMQDQNGPNGDDEFPPAAPDDATGTFLSLHSYADEVLWPWGFGGDAPNGEQLETIGRKLAYYNGFSPTQFMYTVDGDSYDWTYGKFGIASFLFEVGGNWGNCSGFFPAYGCIDGIDGMPRSFWDENRPTFIYLHKIARTPYMTSYGPDTQSVVVTPASVPQGTPTQLTANVADHRFAGDPLQPVYGAEYFFDEPGQDGTGLAMSPSDGTWGETNEDVLATVDTSALAPGRHYILVHGLNDDGDWGPFTAVFLDVTASTDTMHVSNIQMKYRDLGGRYAVQARITILDDGNLPVPEAAVTAEWTIPNGASRSRIVTTNSAGRASFGVSSRQTGVYQICVLDVTKSGYVYNPDQNVETCDTLTVP